MDLARNSFLQVANASVAENQPRDTLVTTLSAVDDDKTGNDGKLTYAIVDGDGVGVFSIDDKGPCSFWLL